MPINVYVIVDGPLCTVHVPYAHRDKVPKHIPGRQWDDAAKVWSWPAIRAGEVLRSLRVAPLAPKLVEAGSPYTRPKAPITGNWAEQLMRASDCDETLYRDLVKVLHPDRGGDLRRMQDLTAARDTVCRGGGRNAA